MNFNKHIIANTQDKINERSINDVNPNEETVIPLQENKESNFKILNSNRDDKNMIVKTSMTPSEKAYLNFIETMKRLNTKKHKKYSSLPIMEKDFQLESNISYKQETIALQVENNNLNLKNFNSHSENQPRAAYSNKNFYSSKRLDNYKNKVKLILDDNIELSIMCFVTIFALFGVDLKILFLNPNHDQIFNYFLITATALFFIELFLSIWAKDGYLKSFFFFLDLFASISMIFEIDTILFSALGFILSLKYEDESEMILMEKQRIQKIAVVVRLLRIIRLIRVVKLYKAAIVFMKNAEINKKLSKIKSKITEIEGIDRGENGEIVVGGINNTQTFQKGANNAKNNFNSSYSKNHIYLSEKKKSPISSTKNTTTNKEEIDRNKNKLLELKRMNDIAEKIRENSTETKISKVLSESITKKVIIIILLMLLVSPITDDDVYSWEHNIGYLMLSKIMNNIIKMELSVKQEFESLLYGKINKNVDENFPLIQIIYNTTVLWENKELTNTTFRYDERGISFSTDGLVHVIYDNRHLLKLSSFLNIVRTIFVIILLLYMAIILYRDSKNLILKPLQTMNRMLESIANDPVNQKKIDFMKEKVRISMNRTNKKKKTIKIDGKKLPVNKFEEADHEIKVLQMAIMKISALMAIGFGEAGGEILRENMKSQDGLNPMLPGKKKIAIFGFCDIRNFAEINSILQEETIVLINEIADIVQSSVNLFGGATNKNLGDAFLNVWKFDHLDIYLKKHKKIKHILKEGDQDLNTRIADQALLSFLHIIKRINRSALINSYRNNKELKTTLGLGENFKIEIGFGLHLGWAIEGAIGSFYKIDCSYLSPHVNISARLETATKQYGVKLLLSGQLHDILSTDLKHVCRMIDVVTLKGCEKPIRLYTVFLNENLKIAKDKKQKMSMKDKKKFYAEKKQKLYKLDSDRNSIISFAKIFLNKKSFENLLIDRKRPNLFYERFKEGLYSYIAGDWESAFNKLKDAYFMDEEDGPTVSLLDYIISNNNKAPKYWNGFRELANK